MSEFKIEVTPGKSVRLLTGGKYCDRNILVTAPNTDDGLFIKVGSMECGYNPTTLSIKGYDWWEKVTAADIYFVPTSFTVTATDSITAGTYNINMSYANGVISAWRDSIPGKVGIAFAMDVYIYIVSAKLSGVGKVVKVASDQALKYGAGISVDVSGIIQNYAVLTVNNFFLDLKKLDINATTTGSGSANVIKSYDAATGVFTFSRASIPFSGSMNNYCDVYAFVPV